MKLALCCVCACMVVTLVIAGCGGGEPATRVNLEIRVAERYPDTDTVPMVVAATGDTLHVRNLVSFTNADIKSADVTRINRKPVIMLTLTDEGAEQLERTTRLNLGSCMAYIVDGSIICAPKIEQTLSMGKTILDADLPANEAKRLAKGITMK